MTFHGPGRPLELMAYPRPQLQLGELLVEVLCCTLCGSDIHTFHGRRSAPCPTILGHEILGRLVDLPGMQDVVDARGKPLAPGDRISWSIAASCGHCFYCRRELPQKCLQLFKYGHEAISPAHPLSGGLAEYCHLAKGTTVVRIGEEVPDHVACPANCATATAAAALRAAGPLARQRVLVMGTGMLGLTATAMARVAQASHVATFDRDPARCQTSLRFGAASTVHSEEGYAPLHDHVRQITDGRGVDVAFDFTGSTEAIEQALQLLRIGGRLVLVGSVFPDRPLHVEPEQLVRRLVRIEGVHNYRAEDLVAAVEFLEAHHAQFPFAELVGECYSLADANRAFTHASQGTTYRVAVSPQLG